MMVAASHCVDRRRANARSNPMPASTDSGSRVRIMKRDGMRIWFNTGSQ